MKNNTTFFSKLLIAVFVIAISSSQLLAQTVGIGTDTPNPNSVLDLVVKNPSTKPQGLLLPRLTASQRTSLGAVLTTVDQGMLVFDVSDNKLYHWDGVQWVQGGSVNNAIAHVKSGNGLMAVVTNDTATVSLPNTGVVPGLYGASDSIPVFTTDAQGRVVSVDNVAITSMADNLGNHIATNNIQLNGNYLSNDGGAEGLSVSNTGNVGIGVLNSSVKLNIAGLVGASLSDGTGMLLIGNESGRNIVFDNDDIQARNNGANGTLKINHYGGAVRMHGGLLVTSQVNFTTNGSLGLGIPAPAEKLHVYGTARLSELAGSTQKLVVADVNGTLDSLTFSGNATDFLRGDGTFGVVPSSADNLGDHKATQNISLSGFSLSNNGVSGTGLKFDNAGNASIGGAISTNYKLYVYGKLKSDGLTEISDRRLKKDIETLEGALDKILQLRGVTYNWRQNNKAGVKFEKDLQIGLIAQEVEAVLPELVDTDDQGYKSVEYSKLVSVLIEGMKEQQTQINQLQLELDALKTKINGEKMKALNASLEVVK